MNEEKINIPQNEAGEAPYIIEMRNITKVFPGIVANDDITLQLKKGEIHALLGENGAGKSTLMSVLFGFYKPEKGEILKNGEVCRYQRPERRKCARHRHGTSAFQACGGIFRAG